MTRCWLALVAMLSLGLPGGIALAQGAPPGMPAATDQPTLSQPILAGESRIQPAFATHGMVAAQEAKAARIGVEILKRGGNAVDAAVAIGFAEAVTLPRAGNL